MYLTEAEAGLRRCQEAYSGAPQSAGPMTASVAGAAVVNHSPLYCIGSACMAWRWLSHPFAYVQVTPDGPVYMNARGEPTESKPTDGYCGKAGKP